ncbi:MAG: hypothetical protein JXR48_15040 [Candidatus Delongbacteria bacterium]|nr:hypothetical protein [Candidatus Delongbacteria bacterium]MBN2836272.1 hypothetical protein [Candidatus Delongbacteria bacterium]
MIYFVINKKSGSFTKKLLSNLCELGDEFFRDSFKICQTVKRDNVFIPEIDDNLYTGDILVAVGGDGTINICLNYIHSNRLNEKVKLGIIPRGTGNNMLLALKLSKDLRKSFEIIKNNSTSTLQYGMINDNHLFFNCSAGFSAYLLKNRKFKSRNGYLLDLIINYGYEPSVSRLVFNDEVLDLKLFHAYFLNTTHYLSLIPFLKENSLDKKIRFFHTEKINIFKNVSVVSDIATNISKVDVKIAEKFILHPADNCLVEIDGDVIPKYDKYTFSHGGTINVISNLNKKIRNNINEIISQNIFTNRSNDKDLNK